MKISVIITSLNDNVELIKTVQSCLATSRPLGAEIEIVVVDDCSANPVYFEWNQSIVVVRNKYRLGVGPSRHIGACLASGEIIFIVDSHCRFSPGWDDTLRNAIEKADLLLCGQMIGFDSKTPDWTKGKPYWGATFKFFGPDKNAKGKTQVFEAVWRDVPEWKQQTTIPACMGACYAMRRKTYLQLGGLQYLREWGCDEQMLSLKFWLSGRHVYFYPGLKIGHKFRTGRERVPFTISRVALLYNKLFCIHTLLDPRRAQILASKIPGGSEKSAAMRELVKNWAIVEAERQHNLANAGNLEERFTSFLKTFDLTFPTA